MYKCHLTLLLNGFLNIAPLLTPGPESEGEPRPEHGHDLEDGEAGYEGYEPDSLLEDMSNMTSGYHSATANTDISHGMSDPPIHLLGEAHSY